MKTRFIELIRSIEGNIDLATIYFNEIKIHYNSKERAYHNLTHIAQSMKEYDNFNIYSPKIELAIWYHDVIYNPKRNDNEEKSSEFAKNQLTNMNVNHSLINDSIRIINSTKHTYLLSNLDEMIMSDIDLSIFGKDKQRLIQYEEGIRFEYSFVPENVYRIERSKILKRFFEKDRIYYIDFFHNRYEEKAKRNLIYLINTLNETQFDFNLNNLPEAGMGLFEHWSEFDKPNDSYEGNLFSHWNENSENNLKNLPEAGIGLFDHWNKD